MASPTNKPDYKAVMKNALQQIQDLKAKVAEAENRNREPIAIIGLGCRLPSGIDTPDQFWSLLQNGDDAIREVPSERWDLEHYFDPDPTTPGKTHVRYGSFVEQIDGFDPAFFNMSPREAMWLDPQQRLLLEVSWEALERANIVPKTLLTSPTGVFIGISGSEYEFLMAEHETPDNLYGRTGVDTSVAAGRISYLLGLTGPCVSVDTACSSSLVALHQACQSLRQRECTLALAGGVGLILRPDNTISFSKVGMLAPDGRCKPFDVAADGFVRGEGCGVIVLKRLADAIADEDNVLAVIRGSMINHDGPSSGLTAPRGPSQQAVIRQALRRANTAPDEVSYIEVHGAGTPLGDPIELGALSSVFHKRSHPLWVGSVKTNIGHLEAAAGIAGLLKVVLMLQHGQIPPHLHFKTPNPHIDWANSPVKIPTTLEEWQTSERVAGISSFGFSGTNAHIVLSQADTATASPSTTVLPSTRGAHLLTLAAKNETALADLVTAYQAHLTDMPNPNPADICYTSNTSRSHFAHRIAITATNVEALNKQLARLAQGKRASTSVRGQADELPPKVAFLFTGQGAQYPDMARQLYETQPLFRQTIDRCAEILAPYLPDSLQAILYPTDQTEPLIHRTQYAQPALFAIEYALAQLWQSWGVEPDVVLGHSTGEYVAACVAGVFTLEEGLMLIAERARLIASVSSGGATASVFADADVVAEALRPFHAQVSIAGINSPKDTLVAGAAEAVDALLATLKEAGVDSRRLDIPHAPHSPLMDPVLDEFEKIARRIDYQAP
ncbi:MAG: type I polyketide synthase, partial [Chloroflexota bacterium]